MHGLKLMQQGDIIRKELPHLDELARIDFIHQLMGEWLGCR